MGIFVPMPRLDATALECIVGAWYVKTGDSVSQGAKLFSMESGKSVDDVLAPCSGIVTRIREEYDEVEVGAPVAYIGLPDEALPPIPEKVI